MDVLLSDDVQSVLINRNVVAGGVQTSRQICKSKRSAQPLVATTASSSVAPSRHRHRKYSSSPAFVISVVLFIIPPLPLEPPFAQPLFSSASFIVQSSSSSSLSLNCIPHAHAHYHRQHDAVAVMTSGKHFLSVTGTLPSWTRIMSK